MSPSNIKVRNLNRSYSLNEARIKIIVSKILRYIKRPEGTDLDFVFLDDKSMRVLNKKYKRRDRPTDVLSFKLDKEGPNKGEFLGEIFISLDTAQRNSRIFKTCFEEELSLYIIHGILHLFGYDDQSPGDRIRMSKREMQTLNYLCKNENLSKVLMRP